MFLIETSAPRVHKSCTSRTWTFLAAWCNAVLPFASRIIVLKIKVRLKAIHFSLLARVRHLAVNTFQIRICAGFEKRVGYFWPSSRVDTGEDERRTTVARL